MQLITTDFETYYDKEFSLSKMQTDAYCKDDRFEVIGVAVKVGNGATEWFSGDFAATKEFLDKFDWGNSAVLCHNTLFDGFIMTQLFGIRPKLWMDTLAMGRMLYPYLVSHSLANLAKAFKLRDKGTEVHNMLGRTRASMSPAELRSYGEYCALDVELTKELGDIMLPQVPPLELKLIDMTIRMFTEPRLVGDVPMMEKLYADELVRKQNLLMDAGLEREDIMSNDKFAVHLQMALGYTPPRKVSPKTGKEGWAFAKTDQEFEALLDHPDPDVQGLVAARLGVKTTIAETRAKNMLESAKRGPLPVYLNYWGAKTTGRYSGGNSLNYQNIPARGPSAGLRYAIKAPPGYSVLVGDSSNIELRVAMVAAGQEDAVKLLRDGKDLYCDFASKLFGRVITKADKKERQIGKIACLGLQYGCGWVKFKDMVRQQTGDRLKNEPPTILSDDESQRVVNLYRNVNNKVVWLWDWCGSDVVQNIANGSGLLAVDHHGWCITNGEGFGVNGAPGVVYHDLRMEQTLDGPQWMYTMGKSRVKLYGGKVVENLCQHVARQIVMWQTARMNERYPVSLSVHDEIVCVVKDEELEEAQAYLEECLSLAPPWCRGHIPLAGETGVGPSYGDAK